MSERITVGLGDRSYDIHVAARTAGASRRGL